MRLDFTRLKVTRGKRLPGPELVSVAQRVLRTFEGGELQRSITKCLSDDSPSHAAELKIYIRPPRYLISRVASCIRASQNMHLTARAPMFLTAESSIGPARCARGRLLTSAIRKYTRRAVRTSLAAGVA